MLVAFFLIAQISHDIPHNWQGNGRPLALFFVFFSVSCLLYFVSIFALTRHSKIPKPRIKPLLGLFLLGLAFRLAFVGSEPILEDDTFRYLWDGALLANGSNPFVYPPLTFLDEANFTDLPESVASLAKSGANTLQQINYPDLTTVYPPVAQLWFAFSYWVSPWSFEAWRGLLILTECLGFVFLILAIRRMGKLTLWGLIYWWNPMVILQFSNGLHVDAVLTSFLFLALYLLLSGRAIPACLPLLAAVGIKLWPIILLPFFLKEFWNRKALFFSLTIAFTVGTALLVSPLLLFQAETVGNGLETYSHLWQMNDGIYTIVHKFSWSMTKFWNEDPIQSWRSAHTLARIVIVSILGLFILYRS